MNSKKPIKIDHNLEVGSAYSFYFCEFNFSRKVHLRQTTFKIPSEVIDFCYQLWNNKIRQSYRGIILSLGASGFFIQATKIYSSARPSVMLFIPLSGVNMRRIFSQFWFHEINSIWTNLGLWALAHKSYYNLASRIELIIWNLYSYNNKAEISLLWAVGKPKGNSIFALALASDLITKV